MNTKLTAFDVVVWVFMVASAIGTVALVAALLYTTPGAP